MKDSDDEYETYEFDLKDGEIVLSEEWMNPNALPLMERARSTAISQREFEWGRFCYFIEERKGVDWPHRDLLGKEGKQP